MRNFRFYYVLTLKCGTIIEQYSNDYYTSSWLADYVLNGGTPVYKEDIDSITRKDLQDGKSNVFSDNSQPELFKQIIEDTEEELKLAIQEYKQRADLF